MRIEVDLSDEEYAALLRFRREHRDGALTYPAAARLLMRDALIGLGMLPLPKGNRSKGAVRGMKARAAAARDNAEAELARLWKKDPEP